MSAVPAGVATSPAANWTTRAAEAQLTEALAGCHRSGVGHRDVKFDNVLLDVINPDAPPRVRLADFGSAAWLGGGDGVAAAEGLVGTPHYVQPKVVASGEYSEKVGVGPGAISTSVWRGARLRDGLRRCGIAGAGGSAAFVCFGGAEDLPDGGGCKYGTSLRREVAMDRARDVILAYMQNGEPLALDHGFPVRVMVLSFIGGRMVKWLKRIIGAPNLVSPARTWCRSSAQQQQPPP
ncbi:hypothetical protein U9M48_028925 [Paspalum notatum var. saurae]|uniref:Protein kinase domain-containing protein n=1 Tax=Paspalum notatum var. saurae TaxID=547442 RepID=A0AAQ3TWF1_PASNO